MDDYESEPMFFAPNNQVIVYGVDDQDVEMGIVIHHDEIGLILRTTHQLEKIQRSASVTQTKMIWDIFDKMSAKDLREYAVHEGLGKLKALFLKTEKLRNACIDVALSKMDEEVITLMPLSQPIKQWIAAGDLRRIKDAEDFIQEGILNRLDFTPSNAYSESKTKPEDTEDSTKE